MRAVTPACTHKVWGRCRDCHRQACLDCGQVIDPERDYEKTTATLEPCSECRKTGVS